MSDTTHDDTRNSISTYITCGNHNNGLNEILYLDNSLLFKFIYIDVISNQIRFHTNNNKKIYLTMNIEVPFYAKVRKKLNFLFIIYSMGRIWPDTITVVVVLKVFWVKKGLTFFAQMELCFDITFTCCLDSKQIFIVLIISMSYKFIQCKCNNN